MSHTVSPMKRLHRPFALGLLLLALGAPVAIWAVQPSAQPTPQDAEKAAAEELQTLPDGYVQVDCNPSLRTLPPYTRVQVVPGMAAVRVLSDGRCFGDPTVDYWHSGGSVASDDPGVWQVK